MNNLELERAKFEAWFQHISSFKTVVDIDDWEDMFSVNDDEDFSYTHCDTATAWEAWQAAGFGSNKRSENLKVEIFNLKKELSWRMSDIRETLLNNGSCDEWSVSVGNLNKLLILVDLNGE